MPADNKTNKKPKSKTIRKKEKLILTVAAIVLAIALILVVAFLLIPRLSERTNKQIVSSLDLNDSGWIEEMAENVIEPVGKAIEISSSFVYSTDTAFITATYGSTTSIENAKQYYLEQIPSAVDHLADEVSQMRIIGEIDSQRIDVVNYEADVLNAFDTKITIPDDMAETIKQKVIEAYPAEFVSAIPELKGILQSEKLGGYVMYNDDELSSTSYTDIPIYSEAYRFGGSIEDLSAVQRQIEAAYDSSVYLEEVGTVYFKMDGHILSLNITESDLNILAVITVQKVPDNA